MFFLVNKWYLALSILLLTACEQKNTTLEELNLITYGLPISIRAPHDAEIKTMEFGLVKDVSIRKDDHYFLQIFASDIRTNNMDKVKNELLNGVKAEPFFDKIVETRDDGFIYKTVMDSTLTTYGFKAIKLIGNNEIVFSQGLMGTFTLDDIKEMYEAVSDP